MDQNGHAPKGIKPRMPRYFERHIHSFTTRQRCRQPPLPTARPYQNQIFRGKLLRLVESGQVPILTHSYEKKLSRDFLNLLPILKNLWPHRNEFSRCSRSTINPC